MSVRSALRELQSVLEPAPAPLLCRVPGCNSPSPQGFCVCQPCRNLILGLDLNVDGSRLEALRPEDLDPTSRFRIALTAR